MPWPALGRSATGKKNVGRLRLLQMVGKHTPLHGVTQQTSSCEDLTSHKHKYKEILQKKVKNLVPRTLFSLQCTNDTWVADGTYKTDLHIITTDI